MSYSKFSTGAAEYIAQELKLDSEKQQVIAYSIDGLLLTIGGFLLIVLVGATFGAAVPAAMTAVAGGLLRRFSGGVHAGTAIKCMIYSSLGYGAAASAAYHLSRSVAIYDYYLIFILVLSLLILAYYAPVDCPAKRIHSSVLRKKLKAGAISFALLVMVLVITLDSVSIKLSLVLGVFLQSLTLLPVFNEQRRR